MNRAEIRRRARRAESVDRRGGAMVRKDPRSASVRFAAAGHAAVAPYANAWDRFWFTPRTPETLALLRIITGAMLLYSHLVLASDLMAFLGPDAWVSNQAFTSLRETGGGFRFTYLHRIDSPLWLTIHHGVTILVTVAMTVGFATRITVPLAWLLQIVLIHRLTGALFGFDQIVTYSAMYLMLTPCGGAYSVDAWLRRRSDSGRLAMSARRWLPSRDASMAANVATRLFQLHLCVIYLFGGLAKARGQMWWDGTAVWFAAGNYEYQSIPITFLASYPRVFSLLTHVTLFWEIFYCALVWPRLTRPLVLLLAIAVHGGIALFLGMITFGVMMIAANLVFIEPGTVRRLVRRFRHRWTRTRVPTEAI